MLPTFPPKETLPHLIRRALAEPRADALIERVNGAWTPTSSARAARARRERGLRDSRCGLAAGDRVALIAHDSVDWIVCDFATLFAGCVVVPIYPTQAIDHTEYILEHSGARCCSSIRGNARARCATANTALPRAVVFESTGDDSLARSKRAARRSARSVPNFPSVRGMLNPDDLAVLIYTSGTTGAPKGVMLSHDNSVSTRSRRSSTV